MMPPEMRHRHTGCVAACPAQIDVRPPWAVRALRWSCHSDCRRAVLVLSLALTTLMGSPRHQQVRFAACAARLVPVS